MKISSFLLLYSNALQHQSIIATVSIHHAISLVYIFLTCVFVFGQSYSPYQSNNRGNTFRQEVARLDITVERAGKAPLPISMVPRVRANDVIKVRMLDQPINGIKPDKSRWNWTLVVAFVNPSRKNDFNESVSREVNFRREGWYRAHALKVPYDSQPIFFLYPRENYRKKIRKLINKNFDQVRKIGEKTLELSNAYAQIGTFLNQLQEVINRDPYAYGNNSGYSSYNPYGSQNQNNSLKEEVVERLAQSFKINLPDCWKGGGYNNTRYGSVSNDFTSRAQCVAQNVKLEDFDVSIAQIIREGGLFAVPKLLKKYPELAQWIGIAAVAVDLILRFTNKTQLRIFPTMASSGNNGLYGNRSSYQQNTYNRYNRGQTSTTTTTTLVPSQPITVYSNQSPTDSNYVSAFPIVVHKWQSQVDPDVINLPTPTLFEKCLHLGRNILKSTDLSYDWLRDPYARDFRLVMSSKNGFTKEIPLTKNIGVSGWEFNLNPQDLASIPKIKMELEAQIVATRGFNRIKSEKFRVPMPGGGVTAQESPQKKNTFRSSYKVGGNTRSVRSRSESNVGGWQVSDESKSAFSVGGKRRIVIKNPNGNCLCLRSIKYKSTFGGEFTFTVNAVANPLRINEDGSFAWFELDTAEFKPGKGKFEVLAFGSVAPQIVPVTLYPLPPEITKLSIHKGDRFLRIEGKWLEQITSINVNGKLANLDTRTRPTSTSRDFVFQNPRDVIISNSVEIDMTLASKRRFRYPNSFPVLQARPILKANEKLEIVADTIGGSKIKLAGVPQDLSAYPIVPVDIEKMTVAVETNLTDYNFRAENISIETRVENGEVTKTNLPQTTFEVIDPVNLRIDFVFDIKYKQFLAGRRLQFRILDRQRGKSNWYTIKQTFVRIPEITSIICKNNNCRITGRQLDYIGEYSTDGGRTWNKPVKARANRNGSFLIVIPDVKDKNLLRIKFRDFENMEGLTLSR